MGSRFVPDYGNGRAIIEEAKEKAIEHYGVEIDRCHIGLLLLEALKKNPDKVHQINGAHGARDTNDQILNRSSHLARCLSNMGLKTNDIIMIISRNNNNVCLPLYAALYNGHVALPVDHNYESRELINLLTENQIIPKICFCELDKVEMVNTAKRSLQADFEVVTLDGKSLYTFMDRTKPKPPGQLRPADFNIKSHAWYISTGGTTGIPKLAIYTHQTIYEFLLDMWNSEPDFFAGSEIFFVTSTLAWVSVLLLFCVTPIFNSCRLHTHKELSVSHFIEIVEKFKPTYTLINPHKLKELVTQEPNFPIETFKYIFVGGDKPSTRFWKKIKEKSSTSLRLEYTLTELGKLGLLSTSDTPAEAVGKPFKQLGYKLIDLETNEEITTNETPGELWIKNDRLLFEGYLNRQDETTAVLSNDGYIKTGDIFYKDNDNNYYFLDRILAMIKYNDTQVSPFAIEDVIKTVNGVEDAAVIGIVDTICGELPIALVVKSEGSKVTSGEIIDRVKAKLSDPYELRGGVTFIENIPYTASGKIARTKLKQILQECLQSK